MREKVAGVGHRIADLALAQHGVVTRAQLTDLSLSRGQIDRLIARGWLHPTYRGVYAVGNRRLTASGRSMAALFAVGERAALSHRSAASLWGLRRSSTPATELTIATPNGRTRRSGIIVHRGELPAAEVTRHEDLPVTTPARTLLDVAAVLPGQLERAAKEAERLRLFDLRALRAVLERNPRRRGARRLAALLDGHELRVEPTRSELEVRFLALCEEHGIERPLVNVRLGPHEVDFLWPGARLVVETDGAATHDTPSAFESDRERDAQLTAAGYRVVRFTYRRVTREPEAVARLVKELARTARVGRR